MKFEQALKAMRRGEVCKAPYTKKKFRIRENDAKPGTDIFQELSTTRRSCTGGDEEVAWLGSGLCGLDVVRDGWKIVRKKKKAPKPMFAEDQLEPVGTMPVVGDKIVAMRASTASSDWSGTVIRVGEIGGDSVRTERGLIGPGCMKGDPDCNYYRILKRPTPPPRNIFKDPRVGDEFGEPGRTWRIIGVSDYEVAYKCVKIRGNPGEHLHLVTRDCFVTHQGAFATLTRVPEKEEVGSPDAK